MVLKSTADILKEGLEPRTSLLSVWFIGKCGQAHKEEKGEWSG